MSIDIHWATLTGGEHGAQLQENIREFIDRKFQEIKLPRFVRSVKVLSFEFGDVPPEVEIKDIGNPLPEFYVSDDDSGSEKSDTTSQDDDPGKAVENKGRGLKSPAWRGEPPPELIRSRSENVGIRAPPSQPGHQRPGLGPLDIPVPPTNPSQLGPQSAGIPGGTSNLTYFHLPLGAGLSGSTTPLAAAAGAHFPNGWADMRSPPFPNPSSQTTPARPRASVSSSTPPSTADPMSRPPSQHQPDFSAPAAGERTERRPESCTSSDPIYERGADDVQVVAHIRYCGNLKLTMSAEILLDYPMPSFVGIPLQIRVTGVRFDGLAVLAVVAQRVHFCFLSPVDAHSVLRKNPREEDVDRQLHHSARPGGLLEEIKVESEIGQKDGGKQVLKNVDKVEKFILAQVRRIFDDEFVYPSFWTFLV